MVFLALDQGRTKTEIVLLNEFGEILSKADDRDYRKSDDDFTEKQYTYIEFTAKRAMELAHAESIDAVSCAITDADWEEEYGMIREKIAQLFHVPQEKVLINNDCIGALRGGTDEKVCAVICAGTELNIAVCDGESQSVYGYYLCGSGGGGASDLGKRAFGAIVDAESGIAPPTELKGAVLKKYGYTEFEPLLHDYTKSLRQIVFKELCPLLMHAAKAGDRAAKRIVKDRAKCWAAFVKAGKRRQKIKGKMTLVLSGGVFKGDGSVLEREIRKQFRFGNVAVVAAKYEPVVGAAALLLEKYGEGSSCAALKVNAERCGLTR